MCSNLTYRVIAHLLCSLTSIYVSLHVIEFFLSIIYFILPHCNNVDMVLYMFFWFFGINSFFLFYIFFYFQITCTHYLLHYALWCSLLVLFSLSLHKNFFNTNDVNFPTTKSLHMEKSILTRFVLINIC